MPGRGFVSGLTSQQDEFGLGIPATVDDCLDYPGYGHANHCNGHRPSGAEPNCRNCPDDPADIEGGTKNLSSFLEGSFRAGDRRFHLMPMLLLLLGHAENAFSTTLDDSFELLQGAGRRKWSLPLLRGKDSVILG